MSWIVVLESEGRQADSIRDALVEDGWEVELVSTHAAAAAAVTARSAQLVIANADLPGASELLGRFAHAASGPGSIALVAPGQRGSRNAEGADAKLTRPLDDNELRLAVRRQVTAGRAPKIQPPPDDAARLTSRELFGDMLAEVEGEGARPAPAAAPKPAPAAPAASAPAQKPSAAPAFDLGSLIEPAKPKPAASRRESPGVDDLLSATLSGLEVGDRFKKPAAAKPAAPKVEAKPPADAAQTQRIELPKPQPPPAVPPVVPGAPATKPAEPAKAMPAAPSPAAPAPSAAPPADAARTQRIEIPKPRPEAPPATKAAEPAKSPAAAKAPAAAKEPSRPAIPETTPARRSTRELDLSSLDALAKGKGREKTPSVSGEVLATQKIAFTPASMRAGQGPVEFGQYTLLERIALGGMAEVWKARRKGVEGFQKIVAIKKILPHLTDSSDFVTMFIDEAKLAAQLNHTNIIHIYDLGKIGDDFFIAMEFVDGKDLRSILNAARDRRMPLPLGLALLVVSRLSSALDYAHRKRDFEGKELGLVHRDVSPQNVLISFEGDIKLCDFGIVKAVSKASKTQMGALKGKLQYMSPEQAWGRTVDARSDIFSLGALLFEMLTGQRLFTGESEMSVLDAVREGRVQAPRDLDPRLPLEVNALVLKALAKDPKDRFASGGDLHREIDAILASLKPAPTQRDLALYMGKLFDAEPRAAAAESAPAAATVEVPKPVPASAAPAPATAQAPAAEAALEPKPGRPDEALESASAGGGKMLWIGIAAAVVIGLVAWMLFGRGGAAPESAPTPPAAVGADTAPTPGAATPATGTEAAPAPAAGAAPPTTAEVKEPEAAKSAEAAKPVDDAAARREEERRKREEEARKKSEAATKAAATKPEVVAPAPEPEPVVEEPEPAPAPVVEEPKREPEPEPARPAPAAPKAPSVREGDLVTSGPGVRAPVLVSFNKPEYPPIARRMRVEGTVVLSLLVDENGLVADVRLERGVSQNVGINEAAVSAAKKAKYQPATKDGVRVKMWHTLTIPFKL
jgi:TonB family protein